MSKSAYSDWSTKFRSSLEEAPNDWIDQLLQQNEIDGLSPGVVRYLDGSIHLYSTIPEAVTVIMKSKRDLETEIHSVTTSGPSGIHLVQSDWAREMEEYNTPQKVISVDDMVTDELYGMTAERLSEGLRDCQQEDSFIQVGANKLLKLNRSYAKTIVHDMTFSCFGESFDTEIGTIHEEGTQEDKLTPDLIRRINEDLVLVLEFGTLQTNDSNALLIARDAKLRKYLGPLERRACATNKKIIFDVIMVGIQSMVCGFKQVPNELVRILSTNYQIGRNIKDALIEAEIIPSSGLDMRMTIDEYKLLNFFKEIPHPLTDKQIEDSRASVIEYLSKDAEDDLIKTFDRLSYCDQDFAKACYKQPNSEYVGALISDVVQESLKEVATNIKDQKHRSFRQKYLAEIEEMRLKEIVDQSNSDLGLRNERISVVKLPGVIPKLSNNKTTRPNSKPLPYFKSGNFLPCDLLMRARLEMNSGNIVLPEDSETNELKIAMGKRTFTVGEMKDFRKRVHRFSFIPEEHERIELAKCGVQGKSLNNNWEVKDHAMNRKKTYSLDFNVNYIEEFINSRSTYQFLFSMSDFVDEDDEVIPLIEMSENLHDSGEFSVGSGHLRAFRNSLFGRYCRFVSDVGTELSLSLRQNCKQDEFIIKKLKHFDCLMIVKPTNSTNHIFYSLILDEEDIEMDFGKDIFKWTKLLESDSDPESGITEVFRMTEFNSLKLSKLDNLVRCEATMFQIYSFFLENYLVNSPISEKTPEMLYKLYEESGEDCKPVELLSAQKMTMLCLMTLLYDKRRVESMMMKYRFIAMEGFCRFPNSPKPHKMLKKLPSVLRNPFEVWIKNCMYNACSYIVTNDFEVVVEETRPREDRLETNERIYKNMYNPYLKETISDPSILINLFYIGYLKNKDEESEGNVRFDIYEKVIEYEEKFSWLREKVGLMDSEVLNHHEFSPSLLLSCCGHVKDHLRKTMGSDFEILMEHDIIREISKLNLENLSTLKASSTFDESIYDARNLKKNNKGRAMYSRKKVLEAMCELVSKVPEGERDSLEFLDVLKVSFKELTKSGHLNIDLFKKAQHGDNREIFVLGIRERILQAVFEAISRAICRNFPQETMTHPKSKVSVPYTHFSNTRGAIYDTTYISADASKWSQSHIVTKFIMMLVNLVPKTFHPFIFEVGKLWLDKRIMLDPNILNMFSRLAKITTSSSLLNKAVRCFNGSETSSWLSYNKTHIQISTGMMQGILHYTSSLLHVVFLFYLQTFFKVIVIEFMKTGSLLRENELRLLARAFTSRSAHEKRVKTELTSLFLVSFMVSSDDSGMIFSFKRLRFKKSISLALSCQLSVVKSKLSRYLAIYDSEKTTNNSIVAFEFNSEYYFDGYLFKPTIRWVAAANLVSEQENLASRQEELYNLSTSVLEGGGSINLTYKVGIGQALFHYRLLGSSVSPVFLEYSKLISVLPDPSLGFWLTDDPRCAGMPGFNYLLWNACDKSILGAKYQRLLTNAYRLGEVEEGSVSSAESVLINTKASTFVQSTMISMGDRKKWLKLKESMGDDGSWIKFFDDNPMELFLPSKTRTTYLFSIHKKLNSPGVPQSINSRSLVSTILASSVFVLSRDVLKITDEWKIEKKQTNFQDLDEELNEEESLYGDTVSRLQKKTNIIYQLNCDLRRLGIRYSDGIFRPGESHVRLTPASEVILFPKVRTYRRFREKLANYLDMTYMRSFKQPRKLRSLIDVFEGGDDSEISLAMICPQKWFKIRKYHFSEYTLDVYFNIYKTRITWLRDTFQETLDASPFDHAHQLCNFLSNVSTKTRWVHLTGSPVKSREGRASALSSIKYDHLPGHILLTKKESSNITPRPIVETQESGEVLLHCLALLQQIPLREDIKQHTIHSLMKGLDAIIETRSKSTRMKKLKIIQNFVVSKKGEESIPSTLGEILELKVGTIGGFTVSQRYNSSEGTYVGDGVWQGVMHGTNVKISINSYRNKTGRLTPTATMITVDRVDEFQEISHDLIGLIKDLNLNTDLGPKKTVGQKVGLRYVYHAIASDRLGNVGVPVILNPDLKSMIKLDDVKDLTVSLGSIGQLTLRATVGRMSFTVLSVRARDYDINKDLSLRKLNGLRMTPFMKSWLMSTATDQAWCDGILEPKNCAKFMGNFYDEDKGQNFCKTLILQSLRDMGVNTQRQALLTLDDIEYLGVETKAQQLEEFQRFLETAELGSMMSSLSNVTYGFPDIQFELDDFDEGGSSSLNDEADSVLTSGQLATLSYLDTRSLYQRYKHPIFRTFCDIFMQLFNRNVHGEINNLFQDETISATESQMAFLKTVTHLTGIKFNVTRLVVEERRMSDRDFDIGFF